MFGDSWCYAGSGFVDTDDCIGQITFLRNPSKSVKEIWQKLALSDKYFIIPILLLLLFRSHVHGISDVKINGSQANPSNELFLEKFCLCF